MESEKIFFESGDIKITSTRLIVSGKTYVLSSIASFRRLSSEIKQTSKGMWLVTCIFAIVFLALPSLLFFSVSGLKSCFFLAVGGGYAYYAALKFKNYKKKYKHKIVLSVASGEVEAFETLDGQFASSIELSLTSAVIHRG